MKYYLLLPLAVAGLLVGCAENDDDHPRVQTSTTTTEETSLHHPAAATTETRTVRSY